MSKNALRFTAVLLGFMIVLVLAAGLDDLPRSVRSRIEAEQRSLAQAHSQFDSARTEVAQALRAEPELFRARSMNTAFPDRLNQGSAGLAAADRDMAALAALNKANHRSDRKRAEQLLAHEEQTRAAALAASGAVQSETRRWLEYKRNLPGLLRTMDQEYRAAKSIDLTAIEAAVQKAETDWPAKKGDLDARLAALRTVPADAEKIWQGSAAMRQQAQSGNLAGLDLPALVDASTALHQAAVAVPTRTLELSGLAGQLYTSWDKILVDMEQRRRGDSRDYLQKIRTVKTRITDVANKKGDTSSDEKWVEVSKAQFQTAENNLGMAIEHKPAGKYDSEAERVAQPAGFAYMAPPSQGSNQYGYWEQRNGQSFWVFYGQYALLRDLLFNRDYRAPNPSDYNGYRTAEGRGQTYYGRESSGSTPKFGTQGSSTQSRYSGSTYMRSGGGFRDSQYATRGGSYAGSQYQSPAARKRTEEHGWFSPSPGSSGGSRSFGRGSSPRPSRSFGGGGRRFGSGGRRR